jgi:hypothetical protein
MTLIDCPYLKIEVELTEERERHITDHHPDLLPEHRQRIIETISGPDQVRRSSRFGNARLFSRWFSDLRAGKFVVVVVVSDQAPQRRSWIVTAYMARRLAEGEVEWTKN